MSSLGLRGHSESGSILFTRSQKSKSSVESSPYKLLIAMVFMNESTYGQRMHVFATM